jgi:hypothetical protein
VKRTAEILFARHPPSAIVRFTDFASYPCHPTSELVGYFHLSAKRGLARATLKQFSLIAFDLEVLRIASATRSHPPPHAGCGFPRSARGSDVFVDPHQDAGAMSPCPEVRLCFQSGHPL